ncbi:hypothetical protein CLOM_g3925 [Closterium sp. NIES-68]|nr:hypothetical protein CLOM_g3925 [Closterium sp. NIES-68]GJP66781.1 hypothetical protein CLOP_g23685 [Closterium sp. NIES-67]GJP82333.1 hypothetical protein CLOP_g12583 [Closterium sp. NIES-67]
MAACASTLQIPAYSFAAQPVSLSSSQRLASTSSLPATWGNARQASSPSHGRQQRFAVRAAAAEEAAKKESGNGSDSEVDNHILPYCDITKRRQRTLGEMEQEFLLALQAYYIGQEPIMGNEEFDNLKEELLWEGSQVVVLSKDEQKFMEASLAYQAGKPFMSDREYDELKRALKTKGSKVAIEGPRCSLRTRKSYSDSMVDYFRMTALNLPAAILALLVVFFFDDISGFEITYLLELPEPWSFVFTWFVVLPIVYLLSQAITNGIFKDFLILQGPCPNCGHKNVSFFGTILTVSTGKRVNEVKCEGCGSSISFDLDTRRITLEALPPLAAGKGAPKSA